MTVEPSEKVTVPLIVPDVAEVTFAVNCTLWPNNDGFGDEATVVVVALRRPQLVDNLSPRLPVQRFALAVREGEGAHPATVALALVDRTLAVAPRA